MEGVICRQKKKGSLEGRSLSSLLYYMKARKRIDFEDKVLSIQKLKPSFCISFWHRLNCALKGALQCLLNSLRGWFQNDLVFV